MIGGGGILAHDRVSTGIPWPEWLVASVRAIKHVLGIASGHAVLGIPLDWPVRFLFIGGLHYLLRRGLSLRVSATICMVFLMGTELIELVAVRNPLHPHSPDLGDLADLASGAAGIVAGELIRRRWTRTKSMPPPGQAL